MDHDGSVAKAGQQVVLLGMVDRGEISSASMHDILNPDPFAPFLALGRKVFGKRHK